MQPLLVPCLRTTRELLDAGLDTRGIAREVREGRLRRVARGAYLLDAEASPTPEIEHRARVLTGAPASRPGTIVSHWSAATLHGLPVPRARLSQVHVTRSDVAGGSRTGALAVHTSRVDTVDVTVVDGMVVTTVPRTLVDLACTGDLAWAVAAMDQALREGTTHRAEVAECLGRVAGVRGSRHAHRMVRLADARSESVGESLSRVLLVQDGLPAPELQVAFRDARGFVGRVDFWWPEHRVVGEFDGRAKYHADARDPESAVWAEKRREDRLRGLGLGVVRWVWDELHHEPAVVTGRVRRALQAGPGRHERTA